MTIKTIAVLPDEIARNLNGNVEFINKYIIPKIEIIRKNAGFFILEEEYTEREWKEMVSLHYINTSYKPRGSVVRIHFFVNEKIESDNYLGFVNLRPISEIDFSLSFIYPNWTVLANQKNRLGGDKIYVMTYKRQVHICGKELVINTFPFFKQDGVVTRCAHADIIMVTKYVRKSLGYKLVKLYDIVEGPSLRSRQIPSEGFTVQQMVEVFSKAEIPVSVVDFNLNKSYFREWMDSYIESGIPVIIASRNHVFVIVGHTLDNKSDKKYLIYDDSGEFFKEIEDDTISAIAEKNKNFVEIIEWKKIYNYLDVGSEHMSYMIVPEMEKFFVPFPYVKENIENFIKYILSKHEYVTEGPGALRKRFLIVDNTKLKNFLSTNIQRIEITPKENFENFMELSLPHYLWFCEVAARKKNGEEDILGFFADPTKHLRSTTGMLYSIIAKLNKDNRLGILTAI